MRIENQRYFDVRGKEIREGDVVFMNDRYWAVYKSVDGELGVDATNPQWIALGKACACQYGIYPFDANDMPVLVSDSSSDDRASYTGPHFPGEIVHHGKHECVVTHVWNDDGSNGITIRPTGNYGFEHDIFDYQL